MKDKVRKKLGRKVLHRCCAGQSKAKDRKKSPSSGYEVKKGK